MDAHKTGERKEVVSAASELEQLVAELSYPALSATKLIGTGVWFLVIRRTCDGAIFRCDIHSEGLLEDALVAAVEHIDPTLTGFTQDAFSVVAAWGLDVSGHFAAHVGQDSCMLPYTTVMV